MYPSDFKYNTEHTWLKLEGERRGRVGITDYAQEQLREIVFIELPEVGSKVVFMEPFGVVESAKATNDLYSPASGVVSEINLALESEPNLVNKDPYGNGWMIIIEISNTAELDNLLPVKDYEAFVSNEPEKS